MKRDPYYDAEQLQELENLINQLRYSNDDSIRVLQTCRFSWASEQQCKKTGEHIALLADRINSLVTALQLLTEQAQEQALQRPLKFVIVFENCPRHPVRDADADSQSADARQSIWPVLRELSWAIAKAQEDFFELSVSRQLRSRTFHSALVRLQKASHREREYLLKVLPRPVANSKIEARYDCESCDNANCGSRHVDQRTVIL